MHEQVQLALPVALARFLVTAPIEGGTERLVELEPAGRAFVAGVLGVGIDPVLEGVDLRDPRQDLDDDFQVLALGARRILFAVEDVEFVAGEGVKFASTSAGSPTKYTKALKENGLIVYHVVPTLRAALKAVDAGVDGLIVEGGEGGGFKGPKPVSSLVLLPLIRSKVDVPIIAAGGICDGVSMAAAFALGAEGVQMGTRMVSAAESPVHEGWKNAIVDAAETDTCFLRTEGGPSLRALRTRRQSASKRAKEMPWKVSAAACGTFTSKASSRMASRSRVKSPAV